MNNHTAKAELIGILSWAKEKLQDGGEPPWAWYQYMKLTETIEAILKGMDSISPTGSLQQSEQRSGTCLRLVDSNYRQDTSLHHPDNTQPQMPM